MLTRDQIIGANDLPSRRVYVEEWGGEVLIRGLTASERDEVEARLIQSNDPSRFDHWRAYLVSRCLVDEAGKRLFGDSDLATLGAKSGRVLDRLDGICRALSGITGADVDELLKNSGSAPSGASGSDSPETSAGAASPAWSGTSAPESSMSG